MKVLLKQPRSACSRSAKCIPSVQAYKRLPQTELFGKVYKTIFRSSLYLNSGFKNVRIYHTENFSRVKGFFADFIGMLRDDKGMFGHGGGNAAVGAFYTAPFDRDEIHRVPEPQFFLQE